MLKSAHILAKSDSFVFTYCANLVPYRYNSGDCPLPGDGGMTVTGYNHTADANT